ncbi:MULTISPECIES: hypothetical protein [Methylobacterium]|uniref:Uncharacterized protein n=1 Tax=Methylobacterium ajmalii TaxID=2738439 RepID=A0ABU9ZQZ7_9HYPH|nr:hypothetical protein [Methylobacterium aquaticum]
MENGLWVPLDLSLFDDYVDPNWAFAIKGEGATFAELDAYWEAHPDEKAESDRRLALFTRGLTLMSIDGSSVNDVYMCGQDGAVYHWDGTRSQKIPVPTAAFLNDILVDDTDTVWICGREGTLLRGNARRGFTLVPCEGQPDFNTVTRFRDKIYLSSYAGPRGVFVCDGRVRQLTTGPSAVFKDINTVDGVADALWAFGLTSVARFDGTKWERIKLPKWSD